MRCRLTDPTFAVLVACAFTLGSWPVTGAQPTSKANAERPDTFSVTTNAAEPTPSARVTAPAAGDTVYVGRDQEIAWEGGFPTTDVNFALYRNGKPYGAYMGRVYSNDGEYTWIPMRYPGVFTPGPGYQVKVGYGRNTNMYIMSDTFTVEYPEVTFVAWPNSDVKHFFGDTIKVSWWGKDSVGGLIGLDLYRDDSLVTTISEGTPNDGDYVWAVPHLGHEGDFRILATDLVEQTGSVLSGPFFLGDVPNYVMLSPGKEDVCQWGDEIDIRWKKERLNLKDVRIQLYHDGELVQTIDSSTSNDGHYQWTVPSALPSSDLYHIGVFETYRRKTRFKGEKFTVRQVFPINIAEPVDSSSIAGGESVHLEWTGGKETPSLSVFYSADSGTTWNMTDSGIVNNGSYEWTAPKEECISSCLLLLRNAAGTRPADTVTLNLVGSPTLIPMRYPTTQPHPTFRWFRWCGEDEYIVTIGTSPQFEGNLLRIALMDTSYTPPASLSPGIYYWRVAPLRTRAFPSLTDTLRIQDGQVPMPEMVDPNPTRKRRITFRWHPVEGAGSYHLLVADNPDFSSPILAIPVSDTSYRPAIDLPIGNIYWKVKSDVVDTYCYARDFSILPDTIPLPHFRSGDTLAVLRPRLQWLGVAGAGSYTIELYNRYPSGEDSPIVVATTADTIFSPEENLSPGMYYWRIESDRAPGEFSPFDSFCVVPPIGVKRRDRLSSSSSSIRVTDGIMTVQYVAENGIPGHLSIFTFGGRRIKTCDLPADRPGPCRRTIPCHLPAGTYLAELHHNGMRLLERVTVFK